MNRHPNYPKQYRYVDLTAGKGFTPDGTKGSPIVFLEQAESGSFKIPYRADFIELNRQNLSELESAVKVEAERNEWKTEHWRLHTGDYRKKVRELFSHVSANEFGLVFVDPSGCPPDFETLCYVAEVRPRMEILIYLSSTNVKRLFQYRHKLLSDYMNKIGKKYWLFRKPVSWDRFKWTFLLGTNTSKFKDYRKIDLFRLDSETGQECFSKVNLSAKQHQNLIQPPLL